MTSRLVRADHHEVFIHSVINLTGGACAVELEISANAQDNFMAEDRIEINGVELARMDAAAATINAGGNTNDGDVILFASPAFETQAGLGADVSFSDNSCGSFVPNAVFAFVLDDPNHGGPNAQIDTLTTDAAFGDDTAMAKFTVGAAPQLIDLTVDILTVGNNAGDLQDIGDTGGGGGVSSGGCSLGGASSFSSLTYFLALAGILAAGGMRIRRR
jgi:MYXO-CTERM domain-containing protein